MWTKLLMTDPTILSAVAEATKLDPHVTDGDQALAAILGYGIVFLGIVVLMLVVTVLGKALNIKKKEKAPVIAPVQVEEIPEAPVQLAPGSAGELKLYDTPPKTAAMLMAIVANQMGKPLNELRFISIKEVK